MLDKERLERVRAIIAKFGIVLRHAMREQHEGTCEACGKTMQVVGYTAYECGGRSAILCVNCAPPIRR